MSWWETIGKNTLARDSHNGHSVSSESISSKDTAASATFWDCPTCGRQNKDSFVVCQLCFSVKPKNDHLASSVVTATSDFATPETWKCGTCGKENVERASSCQLCFTAKPQHRYARENSAATEDKITSDSSKCNPMDSPDEWVCSSCSRTNECSTPVCRLCFTARSESSASHSLSRMTLATPMAGSETSFMPATHYNHRSAHESFRFGRREKASSIVCVNCKSDILEDSRRCVICFYEPGSAEDDTTELADTTLIAATECPLASPYESSARFTFEITSPAVPLIAYEDLVLHHEVARGGFGVVHAASFQHVNVAVKTLLAVNSPADVETFAEEVQMLATIRHPNCLFYFGVCNEPFALVTELMEGGDLHTFIHGNVPRPMMTRHNILIDVARGLAYLHSMDVIHRDIKPVNVLLDKTQTQAKLADFGLSGMKERSVAGAGTKRYAAPEVLLGEPGDKASDVYSFGIVVFEVVMCELASIRSNVYDLPGVVSEVHAPSYRSLVQQCFSSKRPDANEVIAALENVEEAHLLEVPSSKLCENCEEISATYMCKECEECYCDDCASVLHSKGKRKAHELTVVCPSDE